MIRISILIIAIFTTGLVGCTSSRLAQSDQADLRVEVKAVAGKDNIVKTRDGQIIGRADDKGDIYDLAGNKIGRVTYSSNETEMYSDQP
jgi:hypothetical protein